MKTHKMLLLVLLFLGLITQAQNKAALVIGIGAYPQESGWCTIHGDNDIPIVVDMLEHNGFGKDDIQVLRNEKATKQAVMQALGGLIQKANEGDVVYVHFSGHGQQITDLDGDEPDGYDEAWIPYDAWQKYNPNGYVGQSHIIDDELFDILTTLRAKVGDNGKIVVVSDACHSGSGSRGDEDVDVIRGLPGEEPSAEEIIALKKQFKDPYAFNIPNNRTNPKVTRDSVSWLFISACKAYQNNFEYRDARGNYYGKLSYLLWENRMAMSTASWQEVMATIDNRMLYLTEKYTQQSQREGAPNTKDDKLF